MVFGHTGNGIVLRIIVLAQCQAFQRNTDFRVTRQCILGEFLVLDGKSVFSIKRLEHHRTLAFVQVKLELALLRIQADIGTGIIAYDIAVNEFARGKLLIQRISPEFREIHNHRIHILIEGLFSNKYIIEEHLYHRAAVIARHIVVNVECQCSRGQCQIGDPAFFRSHFRCIIHSELEIVGISPNGVHRSFDNSLCFHSCKCLDFSDFKFRLI